jgi:hypothetical protein
MNGRAPSSGVAQLDGSELEQVREEAKRLAPLQFRPGDVEDRLDGAVAVHEREEVRGPCVERQVAQALRGDGEPRNGEQRHVRTNRARRPLEVVLGGGLLVRRGATLRRSHEVECTASWARGGRLGGVACRVRLSSPRWGNERAYGRSSSDQFRRTATELSIYAEMRKPSLAFLQIAKISAIASPCDFEASWIPLSTCPGHAVPALSPRSHNVVPETGRTHADEPVRVLHRILQVADAIVRERSDDRPPVALRLCLKAEHEFCLRGDA